MFGSAPSGISPPSQPGQAFTFNATAGAGGGNSGVPSQNATSMSSAPSFVFGSTPDSQPQPQQQQPGFSFGAASGVGGQQPGLSFGQVSLIYSAKPLALSLRKFNPCFALLYQIQL